MFFFKNILKSVVKKQTRYVNLYSFLNIHIIIISTYLKKYCIKPAFFDKDSRI